jgi:nucleotide-binding universal stress UspA family protein
MAGMKQQADGCILLATDLSAIAAQAYQPAAALARALGHRLVILHVVHDPELAPALAANPQLLAVEARGKLEAVGRELGAGLILETDVRFGEDVVATILECARESGAAFIAVATQGKSGFQRLRLGSVAAGLVRRSRTPVICFPPVP